MKIRRILCPVDFGETTAAGVGAASSLATEYGCELHLLHVIGLPLTQLEAITPAFHIDSYLDERTRDARASLNALIDEEVRDYASVQTEVTRGLPWLEIVRVAEEREIDLIVIPTHGRTGVDRVLFGSTTEKVVRMAPCATLTVHPSDRSTAFKPERIVLATDDSPGDSRVLPVARDLAAHYGAELVLLHVVPPKTAAERDPAQRLPEIVSVDGVKTVRVLGADAAEQIVSSALDELHADLIVMGTHGRTGFAHAFLGSVADKVVRTFPGPVLTVRQGA